MPKAVCLSKSRFGRLIAESRSNTKINGRVCWNCICDCGAFVVVTTKNLRNGGTRSCGCLHLEHAMRNVKINEKPIGYKRAHKQNGRVEVKTESGFIYEHVFLMEMKIGRKLRKGEVVHHKDHDKSNNDISNLELMTQGAHTSHHNKFRGVKKCLMT